MASFGAARGVKTIPSGSTAAQTVSGLAAQPKLVRFVAHGLDSNNSIRYMAIGLLTPTATYCVAFNSSDRITAGSSLANSWVRNDAALYLEQVIAGAITADGFTLTPAANLDASVDVEWSARWGDDYEAFVTTATGPATATSFSPISGLAWTPNVLEVLGGTRNVTALNTISGAGALAMGFAVKGTPNVSLCAGMQIKSGTNPSDCTTFADDILLQMYESAGGTIRISLVSFDAAGVTVTKSVTNQSQVIYCAEKVPKAALVQTTLQGSTGTWTPWTGGDFTPAYVEALAAHNVTTLDGLRIANPTLSLGGAIGAATGEQGMVAYYEESGLAQADNTAQQASNVLVRGLQRTAADTFATLSEAKLQALSSGSVTLDQTDAAPASGILLLLMMGPAAVSTVSIGGTLGMSGTLATVVNSGAQNLGGVLGMSGDVTDIGVGLMPGALEGVLDMSGTVAVEVVGHSQRCEGEINFAGASRVTLQVGMTLSRTLTPTGTLTVPSHRQAVGAALGMSGAVVAEVRENPSFGALKRWRRRAGWMLALAGLLLGGVL